MLLSLCAQNLPSIVILLNPSLFFFIPVLFSAGYAYLWWVYLISLVFLWVNLPVLSLLSVLAGLLVMVFEFFLYREMTDRFYPIATGVNVHGVFEPEKEVRPNVWVFQRAS